MRKKDPVKMISQTPTMATIPAPGPCPPWCPDAGNHPWNVDEQPNPDGTHDGTRFHRMVIWSDGRPVVACEKFETTYDGPFPAVVEITDGSGSIELGTPARVAEFVAAIQDAAAVAFPEDVPESHTLRDAERELRSAEVEVARRSGTPGNQLTAAWIRLGKAHAAMATRSLDGAV